MQAPSTDERPRTAMNPGDHAQSAAREPGFPMGLRPPTRGFAPPVGATLLSLVLAGALAGCGGDITNTFPNQDDGGPQTQDPVDSDGANDGSDDGANDGQGDGSNDGASDGPGDGSNDGANDGSADGANDGANDGSADGANDGSADGSNDGANDGSNDGGDGTQNPSDDPHQRCVDRINELRASVGLGPLQRWTDAETCSDDQAKLDLEGAGAHGSFGKCGEGGQNTCPGWGGGVDGVIGGCLDAMWSEGPPPQNPCNGECFQMHGHYMNMTNTDYTRVACGFFTSADGKTWSNQNFR